MSASKPNNSERNARILDLARQGKAPAQIEAELGLSRSVVSGVLRRARDTGMLPRNERSVPREKRQEGNAQRHDEKEEE
jgi:transposase